ncbi:cell wall hydrolase [Bosea sp. (in: a-proteobacteria)]|uniref:cell wall hydrolase n=1 Tax=Bosea sp. (in: a-proteobacteria) TaxID=1871050 RepID=UPI002B46D6C7|nr:cell wall hydrolase [Bosea sp. (in: a-proteobacteria)]WRH59742.1 MAG: cell wall hydrolase [Bosea sp. (in: a-proteobacteria)]
MRAKTAAEAVRSAGFLRHRRKVIPLLMVLAAPALGACSVSPVETAATKPTPTASKPHEKRKQAIELAKADPREKECLVRAMYFESNRSSESGLLGVGTVVLNRVESARQPETICSVVGAPRQFAPGVLTRSMSPRDLPKVAAVAEDILAGKRNEAVGNAKHFHMAGLRFSYPNMHYVTVAGGNAFYVKGERPERRRIEEPSYQLAGTSTPFETSASSVPTSFASAPLAFAPQAPAAAEPVAVSSVVLAANVLVTAPLPPGRPMDLGLTRKTASASPEARDLRFAALMPESRGPRGSLRQD